MIENARTSELETRYESWWWGEDEEEEGDARADSAAAG
jgi:hypothetical protein